jgi:hypothetical protein
VSPRRLVKQLAGDLDTVVLQALAKSPGSRYATVLALAEDLERHLDGLPVLAHRPSTWYRLRKFVGRNRWPVVIGAGAALVLIAATAIACSGAPATEQQRVAQGEARKATAVKDFLVEFLGAADPAGTSGKPPGQITRQEAIDSATGRIGSRLADQPEAKMAVLDALSSVYESLDQNERSAALLRDALALSELHDGVPHPTQGALPDGDREHRDVRRPGRGGAAMARPGRVSLSRTGRHDVGLLRPCTEDPRQPRAPRSGAPISRPRRCWLERSTGPSSGSATRTMRKLGAPLYLAQTLRSVEAADRAEAIADEAVALAGTVQEAGASTSRTRTRAQGGDPESNGDLRGRTPTMRPATASYEKNVGVRATSSRCRTPGCTG